MNYFISRDVQLYSVIKKSQIQMDAAGPETEVNNSHLFTVIQIGDWPNSTVSLLIFTTACVEDDVIFWVLALVISWVKYLNLSMCIHMYMLQNLR